LWWLCLAVVVGCRGWWLFPAVASSFSTVVSWLLQLFPLVVVVGYCGCTIVMDAFVAVVLVLLVVVVDDSCCCSCFQWFHGCFPCPCLC